VEIHRGNIVLVKRLLADTIGVVEAVEGEGVEATIYIRHLDAPPTEAASPVRVKDVIKLTEQFVPMVPPDIMGAIGKQREFIFKPTKQASAKTGVTKAGVGRAIKELFDKGDAATIQKLLDIIGT
jgi:hypothetical protein